MRGVDRPYRFFRKLGISHTVSSRFAHDDFNKISLKNLLKICIALNCTPNDLLEWHPTEGQQKQEHLALHALKPRPAGTDMASLFKKMTPEQMEEIARVINKGK